MTKSDLLISSSNSHKGWVDAFFDPRRERAKHMNKVQHWPLTSINLWTRGLQRREKGLLFQDWSRLKYSPCFNNSWNHFRRREIDFILFRARHWAARFCYCILCTCRAPQLMCFWFCQDERRARESPAAFLAMQQVRLARRAGCISTALRLTDQSAI